MKVTPPCNRYRYETKGGGESWLNIEGVEGDVFNCAGGGGNNFFLINDCPLHLKRLRL